MSPLERLIKDLCPQGVRYESVGELAEVGTGRSDRNHETLGGTYPLYVRSREVLRTDTYEFDEKAIVIPGEGGVGDIFHYIEGKYALHQRAYRISFKAPKVDAKFAYYYFQQHFKSYIGLKAVSATVTSIRKAMIADFAIPVPPLEIQSEIVRILDTFNALGTELEAELEARKKQYLAIGRKLLPLTSSGTNELWASLGDVVQIKNGSDWKVLPPGDVPVFGSGGVIQHVGASVHSGPSVLIPRKGSIGNIFYVDRPFWTVDTCFYTEINMEKADPKFLYHYLLFKELASLNVAGGVPSLTQTILKTVPFPLIELNQQQEIAQKLDAISDLIESPNGGLAVELAARRKQYEYYRDQLLTFKEA